MLLPTGLYRDQKYAIYVYPSWTLDYAFKTYSSGSGLDQQQTLNTYGFFLSSGVYRWQEFIPRRQ